MTALLMCWLIAGCALVSEPPAQTAEATGLPPIPPPEDAVELEVMFIDRPAGDLLIGDALWSKVDQIAGLDPEQRVRLQGNGVRVGVIGSNPPRMLRTAIDEAGVDRRNGGLSVRSIPLRAGNDSEIQVADSVAHREVTVLGNSGPRSLAVEDARCVLRLTARRVDSGWAELQFQPELHHGDMKMRRVASEYAWQFRGSQQVEPIYDQGFSVELNVGEMVLIGATEDDRSDSLGGHFFRSQDEHGPKERLLIVRVARVPKLHPVRAE